MAARPKPQTRVVAPPPEDSQALERFVGGDSQGPGGTRKSPEVPPGTPGLHVRKGGRVRRRMALYLDVDVAQQLTEQCRAEGREMSVWVNEAVREMLAKGRR